MSNSQELAVWKERWNALDNTMATMETSLAGWQSMGFSRMETLQNLAKCLRAFATGQFHFFYYGFGGEQKPPNLEPHADYPPHYVFRGIINQIFHDIEVIQRAANQRIYSSAEMKKTLETADKLAWAALEPAANLLESPKTTVITYFQKFGSIRVIPYAPVALIGVPFSCMEAPRDFLAIPHEVGHYVYRHGKINTDDSIRKALNDKFPIPTPTPIPNTTPIEKWARKWIEEIFADVYGCLIAGPVIALDFQDLQLEHSPDDLDKDDGQHPVPSLRPKIYTRVLRDQEQFSFAKAKTALDMRWRGELGNGFRKFKPKGINEFRSHTEVMGQDGPVKNIVSEALTKLQTLLSLDDDNWWKRASSVAKDANFLSEVVNPSKPSLQGMYQKFKACLRLDPKLVDSYMPPDADPPEFEASTECETVDLNSADPVGDWHTKPYFKTVFDLEDPDWWVNVWVAEGWTTRGNGRWVL